MTLRIRYNGVITSDRNCTRNTGTHTLVITEIRPGSYDIICISGGCDYKNGFSIIETVHSAYKGSNAASPNRSS